MLINGTVGDIHTYYNEMIEEFTSTKHFSTIHLCSYFIMQYVGNWVVFVQFGWITQLWSLDIFSSATQNIFVHFIT